jgi:uncharacterized iron-regulated membrane protein
MQSTIKSRNWLLAKFRKWHTWTGLLAALFILVVAASGIILNYKKPIFTALGLEARPVKQEAKKTVAHNDVASLPVSFAQALDLSEREMGLGSVERVELKREAGTWIYKIRRAGGRELWIDGVTGATFTKGEYTKAVMDSGGKPRAGGTDWGKLVLDLHTGKIGGETGKAIMTIAAVVLLFLTLSGVYLYAKPLLIRRRNASAVRRAVSDSPIHAGVELVGK